MPCRGSRSRPVLMSAMTPVKIMGGRLTPGPLTSGYASSVPSTRKQSYAHLDDMLSPRLLLWVQNGRHGRLQPDSNSLFKAQQLVSGVPTNRQRLGLFIIACSAARRVGLVCTSKWGVVAKGARGCLASRQQAPRALLWANGKNRCDPQHQIQSALPQQCHTRCELAN